MHNACEQTYVQTKIAFNLSDFQENDYLDIKLFRFCSQLLYENIQCAFQTIEDVLKGDGRL